MRRTGIVLAVGSVLAGIGLIMASSVWCEWFPPRLEWTSERRAELARLNEKVEQTLLQLKQMQRRKQLDEIPATAMAGLNGVIQRRDALQSEAIANSQASQRTADRLRVSGALLLTAGGIGAFLVSRLARKKECVTTEIEEPCSLLLEEEG